MCSWLTLFERVSSSTKSRVKICSINYRVGHHGNSKDKLNLKKEFILMIIGGHTDQQFLTSLVYELAAPRRLIVKNEQTDLTKFGTKSVYAKTLFSSISTGTEIAAWSGKSPLRPSVAYPRVVGYCNVAKVQSVGSAIDDLAEGDIILTHQSHRSAFCCSREDVLIHVKNIDIARQKLLATTYLYHLGYSALLDAGYKPGFEVVIIGLGALGFASASLVAASGGSPIILSGRKDASNIMRYIPFSHFVNKNQSGIACQSVADLDGADLIINTSDSWDDYELGLKMIRRGGTIMLVGFPGRGMAMPAFNPLDSKYIYDKAVTVSPVGHYTDIDVTPINFRFTLKRNLAYLYSLLLAGRVDPTPLMSASYPWDDLEGAYNMLEARPKDSLSAILDWTH